MRYHAVTCTDDECDPTCAIADPAVRGPQPDRPRVWCARCVAFVYEFTADVVAPLVLYVSEFGRVIDRPVRWLVQHRTAGFGRHSWETTSLTTWTSPPSWALSTPD